MHKIATLPAESLGSPLTKCIFFYLPDNSNTQIENAAIKYIMQIY